ncbi:MAG: DUF721 domain-containing protein [Paraperlucidibaca sp.]
MRTNQLLSLTDVLQRPAIARWQRRFAISTTHESIWRSVLDDSLRSSCRLYSYQQGVLTVAVYHTTAATQLRYLNRILIQQLKTHDEFSALTAIRTSLRPAPDRLETKAINRPKKKPLRISRNSAEHLITVANSISDAELSKKLRDLARHSV